MKYSNSFNLTCKMSIRKIIAIMSAVLFCIFASITAVKIINNQAIAVTNDGDQVTVSYDGNSWTQYGANWRTPVFTVAAGGNYYLGVCGSPKMLSTEGTFHAQAYWLDNDTLREMALIAFIYTQDSGNPLIAHGQQVFFGQSPVNRAENYALLHAITGYLNMGRNPEAGDLTNEELSHLQWMDNTLGNTIRGSSETSDLNDLWVMAKNYRLYGLKQNEIQAQGMQDILWIENDAQFGNIKINKCDGADSSCAAQGSASLSGVTFTVKYAGNDRIYNQQTGEFYNNGTVVTTVTTGNDGTATVSNLPLGDYTIEETSTTNPSYVLNVQSKNVTLSTNGATVETTFNNQVSRGDVHFTKKNINDGSVMSNVAFRITSKTTGENHIVVSDSNGIVNTAANAHNNQTNGYDSVALSSITYKGYGTWFGKTPVDNSLGALPYDSYEIVELDCKANGSCIDIASQKKSFTIDSNNQNVNLGTWENDCVEYELATTASDKADGDKYVEISQTAGIKDTIQYCAKPGVKYTIKGVLMDKNTGEKILVNGAPVEQSITITPTKMCDQTEMTFDFDASELGYKEIVVFESLYDGNNLIVEHKDINDKNQTVELVSLATTASDKADGDKILSYGKEVEIKDSVRYCLKSGQEYTVKGILMNKATEEKIIVNGHAVESDITFTPEQDCGEIDMFYNLDTTNLGGAELVVFESLYMDDELIVEHNDFSNVSETVTVEVPVPDTGLFTKERVNGSESNENMIIGGVAFVAVGVCGYIALRFIRRGRILRR